MIEGSLDPDCRLCGLERGEGPEGGWVYRDEHWSVGILEGYEVPGWLAAQVRRHAVGTFALNATEQESLGPLLTRLSRAVATVTGAEKVYLTIYGETFPHWHFLLMTRGAEVPTTHRGAQLILNRMSYIDRSKAITVAARIRETLASPTTRSA